MSKAKPKAPPIRPYSLLAIDPAAAAGWALFINGNVSCWGAANGATWRSFSNTLDHAGVRQYITETPNDMRECVIEDGFPTWGSNQSFKGTMTLGRRRGIAQSAAESMGFDKFTYISPSTWQNALGWRRGQDTKEWSLAYVKTRYGISDISHDTSDALALGTYYLGTFGALT